MTFLQGDDSVMTLMSRKSLAPFTLHGLSLFVALPWQPAIPLSQSLHGYRPALIHKALPGQHSPGSLMESQRCSSTGVGKEGLLPTDPAAPLNSCITRTPRTHIHTHIHTHTHTQNSLTHSHTSATRQQANMAMWGWRSSTTGGPLNDRKASSGW